MIDQTRIEAIKLMPVNKAKAAMKEYAAELGVTIKAKTIDNMVSEMNAQVKPRGIRAKGITILPAAIEPMKGQSVTFYAKLEDIADPESCTFEWSFKSATASDFTPIANSNSQRLIIDPVEDGSVGEYKCKITESGGAITESAEAASIGTLSSVPDGFPMHNLYKATWIDFYSRSFAPVYWGSIYKMMKIIEDTAHNSNPTDVHTEMAANFVTVPLLNLISNTTELVATDSKDGYRYLISAANFKDKKITVSGRFNKYD